LICRAGAGIHRYFSAEEIVGMKAILSSVRNGRFEVIVSRDRFDVDIVEDILRDAS
jgi:hypothetical protein